MWLPDRRGAVFLLLVAGVGGGMALLLGTLPSHEAWTPAATRTPDERAIFETQCAVCHGPMGKGNGPGAEVVRQRMMEFTDAAAMRAVNDRFLFDIIEKGGSQFGRSNAMPAWGMKVTDEQIRAVVTHIRSLAFKNPPASSGRKDTP